MRRRPAAARTRTSRADTGPPAAGTPPRSRQVCRGQARPGAPARPPPPRPAARAGPRQPCAAASSPEGGGGRGLARLRRPPLKRGASLCDGVTRVVSGAGRRARLPLDAPVCSLRVGARGPRPAPDTRPGHRLTGGEGHPAASRPVPALWAFAGLWSGRTGLPPGGAPAQLPGSPSLTEARRSLDGVPTEGSGSSLSVPLGVQVSPWRPHGPAWIRPDL